MSSPATSAGPAAGIVNALVMCAGLYAVVVTVALAAGHSALLLCLLLLVGLLQAGLAALRRSAVATTSLPVAEERSASVS